MGHVVHKGKIAADQSELDKIREWPFPTTGTQMASFLGLCNYYPRIIPHLVDDAVTVYKQTMELRVLPMPELSDSFPKLNSYLCDSVALKLPNPEKPFLLETDASSVAVGAVLKQMDGEEEVSTLFYSLDLNSAQRNYSTSSESCFQFLKPSTLSKCFYWDGTSGCIPTTKHSRQFSIMR